MPKHTSDRPVVVGIAWFDRKQWKRLVETVEDRSQLEKTYEQWHEAALEAVRMIEGQGQRAEKVHVEVESLMSWCQDNGLPVNAESRAEYVAQIMRRRHGRAKA